MKLLVIHSLAIHGTASLKAMMSILGTRVLPLPSMLLTGLTSIAGVEKTSTDLRTLMRGSLQIAREVGETLGIYVGYLGNSAQAHIILELMEEYRDVIELLIVDPVSGDHGRLYVPESIVATWPLLLEKANWTFPNFTELRVHAGYGLEDKIKEEVVLEGFRDRYPQLSFLATSLDRGDQLGLYLWHREESLTYEHRRLPSNFGGTGDVFASYFILQFIFKLKSAKESLSFAAQQTVACMERTIEAGEAFLVIQ